MATLTKERKGYGFWVYTDLMNEVGYFLDTLLIHYLIQIEKYSPNFTPTNQYLCRYLGTKEEYLISAFERLLEKDLIWIDKDGTIRINPETISKIIGCDVFEK